MPTGVGNLSVPIRVLLIESTAGDPALFLTELRRGGYEPSWCRVDNAHAFEAALAEEWAIVLCNWHLPGFTGAQALAMLRARRMDVPLIAISLDPRQDGAVEAIKAGADDFVAMEVPSRLLPIVERALREADARRVRRRAEEALRDSGERFAQAFEHAPIGMALVGLDGITLQVNRAFCEMFGYSEAEMAGMPVWRVTHPDDMPITVEQLRRLIEGESRAWYLEKRYFHRSGRLIWARCSTWLVRSPDGEARYLVSHLQDITEQKQLEDQLRNQQGELAHVLRVATMGEMVAEIAHEINQPLASIANFANGLATRLARGVDDVEALRTAATYIADEALRASDVIRHLRDFLRKGEPKRQWCDVSDLVRDAVRLIEPETRQHGIDLTLDLAATPLRVEVDRVQVEQVVLNLLRNSVEALAAKDTGQRQLSLHTGAGADAMVIISVSDSGVGLPCAAESKIFDAFFTTKEHGLGLGLSISRSIIAAHGGQLWARSNPSEGTTVAFTLPGTVSNRLPDADPGSELA
jgi:PAS domain S-box-containing protein